MPGSALDGAAPSRRSWWHLGLAQLALMLLAFYRGFRAPNLWSLNYYQVSWADGFFRRGLLGSLLLPFGCARFDPHFIWIIQFSVLAAALLLMLRLGRRGMAGLFLCLFFATDAGAFLFHEVGYPEQLLLLLSLACGGLLTRGRPWAAALLLAVCALVHEMAVFTVFPFVLLLWSRLPSQSRPSLWILAGPLGLVLAALAATSAPLADATLQRYSDLARACGHALGRPNFLGYYQESFAQEFRLYYHPVELAGVVLPLLVAFAFWIFSGGALPQAGIRERWAALSACAAPLLLGFIGTDINRWVFLVLTQCLLVLGSAPAEEARPGGPSRKKRLALALPLVFVLLLTHIRFFDGFQARSLDWAGISGFGSNFVRQWSVLPTQ
jgi:hypothetical protein